MSGGRSVGSRRALWFLPWALGAGFLGCSGGDAGAAGDGGAAGAVRVVVNEVYVGGSDPLSDPDWAELKNLADSPADLSGYRLRDAKSPFTMPAGTTVPGRGYLMIYCDDVPDGGATDRLHAPFKLGSADELSLLAPDGSVLDSVGWTATMTSAGRTWGRLPDGTGQYLSLTPTPSARNL